MPSGLGGLARSVSTLELCVPLPFRSTLHRSSSHHDGCSGARTWNSSAIWSALLDTERCSTAAPGRAAFTPETVFADPETPTSQALVPMPERRIHRRTDYCHGTSDIRSMHDQHSSRPSLIPPRYTPHRPHYRRTAGAVIHVPDQRGALLFLRYAPGERQPHRTLCRLPDEGPRATPSTTRRAEQLLGPHRDTRGTSQPARRPGGTRLPGSPFPWHPAACAGHGRQMARSHTVAIEPYRERQWDQRPRPARRLGSSAGHSGAAAVVSLAREQARCRSTPCSARATGVR